MYNWIFECILSVPFTEPEVLYQVRVEAGSRTSCSSVTTVDCYAMEGAPPVITGVVVERLSDTTMRVDWTPPNKAQSNGFIRNFIVTYNGIMEARIRTTRQGAQGAQTVSVPSNRSEVVIPGLEPQLAYTVSVTATTGGGTSESESIIVYSHGTI